MSWSPIVIDWDKGCTLWWLFRDWLELWLEQCLDGSSEIDWNWDWSSARTASEALMRRRRGVVALLGSSWRWEDCWKLEFNTLIFHCQPPAIYSHDFQWKLLKVTFHSATYHANTRDHFWWIIWSCWFLRRVFNVWGISVDKFCLLMMICATFCTGWYRWLYNLFVDGWILCEVWWWAREISRVFANNFSGWSCQFVLLLMMIFAIHCQLLPKLFVVFNVAVHYCSFIMYKIFGIGRKNGE